MIQPIWAQQTCIAASCLITKVDKPFCGKASNQLSRAIAGILAASLLISVGFGSYGLLAFPVVLVAGTAFGLPMLLLFRKLRWLSWWHAMIGGALCAAPLVLYYLSINPGHTEHVGLYNSVYAIGLGSLGGLVAWVVGVFRNPSFIVTDTAFPGSIVLALPILAALYLYHDALRPHYLYGCITSYEAAEHPTPWNHSYITVETEDGGIFRDGITVGNSDPKIVGNCAWGSRKRTASLRGFYYSVHSVDSNGCSQQCPNRAPDDA